MQPARAEWGAPRVYLALDTSLWWHTSWLVRRALGYRGRAIPLVWTVLATPSRGVAYHVDTARRDQVAERLSVPVSRRLDGGSRGRSSASDGTSGAVGLALA